MRNQVSIPFAGAAHRAARERPDEGIGPYEKNAALPVFAVSLSPTATKALSNRGVPSPRLPPSQRQRKTRYSVSTEPPAPLRRRKGLPNWRSRKMGSGADFPCQGEMSRSDRWGRVGDYGHEVSIGAVPGGVLPTLPPRAK